MDPATTQEWIQNLQGGGHAPPEIFENLNPWNGHFQHFQTNFVHQSSPWIHHCYRDKTAKSRPKRSNNVRMTKQLGKAFQERSKVDDPRRILPRHTPWKSLESRSIMVLTSLPVCCRATKQWQRKPGDLLCFYNIGNIDQPLPVIEKIIHRLHFAI